MNFSCPGSSEVANRNSEGMREARFHSQEARSRTLIRYKCPLLVHLSMSRSHRDSPALLTKALLNIRVSPVTVDEKFSLALSLENGLSITMMVV